MTGSLKYAILFAIGGLQSAALASPPTRGTVVCDALSATASPSGALAPIGCSLRYFKDPEGAAPTLHLAQNTCGPDVQMTFVASGTAGGTGTLSGTLSSAVVGSCQVKIVPSDGAEHMANGQIVTVYLPAVSVTAPAFVSATFGEPDAAFSIAAKMGSAAVPGVTYSCEPVTPSVACPAADILSLNPATGEASLSGDGNATDYRVRFAATSGERVYRSAPVTLSLKAAPPAASRLLSISSTNADGVYGKGKIVDVSLIFSEPVRVSGTKNLKVLLETGSTDREAIYLSGSGTSTLRFRYVVQDGDQSADLAAISVNAPAGTVTAVAGSRPVALAIPAGQNLSDSKAIVIGDSVAPVVSISAPNPALVNQLNEDAFPISGGCSVPGGSVSIRALGEKAVVSAACAAGAHALGGIWSASLDLSGRPSGPITLSAALATPAGSQSPVVTTIVTKLAASAPQPCVYNGQTILHGQSASRQRFPAATVPYDQTCQVEIQTAACSNGVLGDFTGSAVHETCASATPLNCTHNSQPVLHNASVSMQRFQAALVAAHETCQEETRTATCTDGTLSSFSGNFTAESCAKEQAPVVTASLLDVASDGVINQADATSGNSAIVSVSATPAGTAAYAVSLSAASCDASQSFVSSAPIGQSFAAMADGAYKICARVTTALGSVGYGASEAFVVDRAGPGAFSINAVASPSASPVSVSWQAASDAVSYRLLVDGAAGQDCVGAVASPLVMAPNTSTSLSLSDASYKLCVIAADANGNETAASNNAAAFSVLSSFDPSVADVDGSATSPVTSDNRSPMIKGDAMDDATVSFHKDSACSSGSALLGSGTSAAFKSTGIPLNLQAEHVVFPIYVKSETAAHTSNCVASGFTYQRLPKKLASGLAMSISGNVSFSGAAHVAELPSGITLLIVQVETQDIGRELWRTDGTEQGTYPLKNINPRPSSNDGALSSSMVVYNGEAYFAADEGTNGTSGGSTYLWKSNGTEAGTVRVATLNATTQQNITQPMELNGILYFGANHPTFGFELWRTDGTEAGTYVVKDINTAGGSTPLLYGVVNGALLFRASSSTHGVELWRTDGTEAGTALVSDINPNASSGLPSNGVVLGSNLIFTANNGVDGAELWISDGVPCGYDALPACTGTRMLRDIHNTAGTGSSPANLTVMGGAVYFAATASGTGNTGNVWRTDGTNDGGTGLVECAAVPSGTCRLSNNATAANNFVVANGAVYYVGTGADNTGSELYRTQGTPATTGRVYDLCTVSAGCGGLSGSLIATADGSKVFMGATDMSGNNNNELWAFSTSEAASASNPYQVKDINDTSPTASSSPVTFARFGQNKILFQPNTLPYRGREIMVSDGTSAGTKVLREMSIVGTPPQTLGWAQLPGGVWLFVAADPENGREIWRTDGTVLGTFRVSNACPGPCDFSNGTPGFYVRDGVAYFAAGDSQASTPVYGTELWRSDGTVAGTYMLVQIAPGSASSQPSAYSFLDGHLYFGASDPVSGSELFRSDLVRCGYDSYPACSGTVRLTDISTIGSSFINSTIAFKNSIFFNANDNVTGAEPYKYTPSTGLVEKVADLNPSSTAQPSNWINVNDELLYFTAAGATNHELFVTDGTVLGASVAPSPCPASGAIQTTCYFDIAPGSANSAPDRLTRVGNRIYFFATNGASSGNPGGKELWRTDGTTPSTVMVADILPGNGNGVATSTLQQIMAPLADGSVVFRASDTTGAVQIWKSDGVPCGYSSLPACTGTAKLAQLPVGAEVTSANTSQAIGVGQSVFFKVKESTSSGHDLWQTDGTAAGTQRVLDNPMWPNQNPWFFRDGDASGLYFIEMDSRYFMNLYAY